MSQQHNKVIKRQRRLAYEKRRKVRARQAKAAKTAKAARA
jgi:hypothetical protein